MKVGALVSGSGAGLCESRRSRGKWGSWVYTSGRVELDNVFMRANREAAFREVRQHFPDCWGWVKASYLGPSSMVFGKEEVWSQVGFHQGDPMAPLLFSLTLQPVVDIIQGLRDEEGNKLKLHVWYLDDGVFIGTREMLAQVVDIIEREGLGRGLV